jgi:hypothetical protein
MAWENVFSKFARGVNPESLSLLLVSPLLSNVANLI